MNLNENLKKGALNLILNCAELTAANSVLIIAENEKFGWYDKSIADVVKKYCKKLQISTDTLDVGEPTGEISNQIQKLSNNYDCLIYFSRLGDLQRFENVHSCKVIMSYARNVEMLSSKFGTTNFKCHLDLKHSIDQVFSASKKIKITCPLGTDITGNCSKIFLNDSDVAIKRFPMVVHSPISASNISGTVVVKNFLSSSGSRFYSPPYIKLKGNVTFHIESGLIHSITGDEKDVRNIKDHYNNISKKFGISKEVIHSWHCGIHNGLMIETIKINNPDYWSNTVFGNPKYLHFHTCGNYAPGEICWMVENQTISLDDLKLWENGKIMYDNFPPLKKCTEKWPELLSF